MIHGYYVEIEPIITHYLNTLDIHVFYFCGGRGIGKTYGGLDFCKRLGLGEVKLDKSEKDPEKFLYVRRTGVEANTIALPATCPFKKYNKGEGTAINGDFIDKLGIGNFYFDDEKKNHIGYCAALSTFANLRGVDFTDVTLIFYDEVIPENKNKRPLKDEGFLLLNMIETINRNRALEGKGEVVVVLLSNPIDLASDLLSQVQITPVLNSMIFKNQEKYTDKSRSLHIEKYKDHKVSKDKEEKSFLYKFAKGTGFNERALSGDFIDNDLSIIKKVDLSAFSAYLSLENICVYRHKSDGTYHISQTMQHAQYVFKAYEKEKFRTVFYWLYKLLVVERKVTYDNYSTKVVFESMIRYKPL